MVKNFEEIKPMPVLEAINKDTIVASDFDIRNALAEFNYHRGTFRLAKDRCDYGFVDNIFCHIKQNPGLPDYNGKTVIVRVAHASKGDSGIILADEDAEKALEKATQHVKHIMFMRQSTWAHNRYNKDLEEWNKEKAAYEATGFHAESIDSYHEHNYGIRHWEDYVFNREISFDEFIAYLKALGKRIVGKTVDAPIIQGRVNLYNTGYSIRQETSAKWTRFENEPYDD